jgi:hypothetical protein
MKSATGGADVAGILEQLWKLKPNQAQHLLELHPTHWIGRIVDGASEAQLDVPPGQLAENVATIRQRSREPVELRHHLSSARRAGSASQRPGRSRLYLSDHRRH